MRFKNFTTLLLFLISGICAAQQIKSDTLMRQTMSIRAVCVDRGIVWYAADQGRIGQIRLNDRSHKEIQIKRDTLSIEFRSIAQTEHSVYALSIGSPALLYKISKSTLQYKLVYTEAHPKVFYDSMQFWNDTDGIAVGDPTDECFSILLTHDGGKSWRKLSCDQSPKIEDGEAFFAASNTNIVIKGKDCWLVSGGKKSRTFHSSDYGLNWTASQTPIVQGKLMTGIFTADFYDSKNGFIAGGDYENLKQNHSNKALTKDGGKSWTIIAENSGFGYASCIQYIPGSDSKGLVCIGATGVWRSNDGGKTWTQLSSAKDLYTLRFIDSNTAIAAGRNIILRLHLKS